MRFDGGLNSGEREGRKAPMKALFLSLLILSAIACEKSKTPEATAPKKVKDAEVEFFGSWSAGEVAAAKYVFVAQAEPCLPVPEKPTRFGEATLDKPGKLFAEFYVPQGSIGHACVYGLDEAGKIVSAANSTQNPLTFKGDGEVIFGKLDYALKAP
jgi:hypothetical protein